jgi:hypothetical protein
VPTPLYKYLILAADASVGDNKSPRPGLVKAG